MHAALAQSVERRLGKAEVGGSIPLGSLKEKLCKSWLIYRVFYFMGFSLLSEMEFFAVPKNGISLNI